MILRSAGLLKLSTNAVIFLVNGPVFSFVDSLSAVASVLLTAFPPRLTAMVKSVVSLKVGAIGTGFKTPPSIRSTPSELNGVKNSARIYPHFFSMKNIGSNSGECDR